MRQVLVGGDRFEEVCAYAPWLNKTWLYQRALANGQQRVNTSKE